MEILRNTSFLVLCPEINIGGVKTTISSIQSNFPESSYFCVTGNEISKKELKELQSIAPILIGKKTITSLINSGVNKSDKEWCFILMSGFPIKYWIIKKYNNFVKNNKDILYSVYNKKNWTFDLSTINGIFLNKKSIKEIGDFVDDESIVLSKLDWWNRGVEKGYCFKGIVGAKI